MARDRRWAQGNLQHLGIVFTSNITTMGRLHLLMGATSYLMSLVWASSLIVGIVLALQGQQMIPSYFIDERTLFPVWPVTDPGAALRLFFATMLIVLMPKFLGLVLEIKRVRHARETFGTARAILGVHHGDVLLDPDVADPDGDADGGRVPGDLRARLGLARRRSRDAAGMPFTEAVRYHRWHMLIGVVLGGRLLRGVGPGAGVDVAGHRRPGAVGAAELADVAPARPVRAQTLLSTRDGRSPPAIVESARRATGEWADHIAMRAIEPGAVVEITRAA